MKVYLVCMVLAVHLSCICADDYDPKMAERCMFGCMKYLIWGHSCQTQRNCIDETTKVLDEDCAMGCMAYYDQCTALCEEHYEQLNEHCGGDCEDESCEDDCFQDQFEQISSDQLPQENPYEVGIWQGLPWADEGDKVESRAAHNENSAKRDDSFAVWSEEDDDFGDLLGRYKKRADSWGSVDDDVFGDLFGGDKKRDASWGSVDDDLFGDLLGEDKKRDASWGSVDDDLFGDLLGEDKKRYIDAAAAAGYDMWDDHDIYGYYDYAGEESYDYSYEYHHDYPYNHDNHYYDYDEIEY